MGSVEDDLVYISFGEPEAVPKLEEWGQWKHYGLIFYPDTSNEGPRQRHGIQICGTPFD
jgi:hypothetical protein